MRTAAIELRASEPHSCAFAGYFVFILDSREMPQCVTDYVNASKIRSKMLRNRMRACSRIDSDSTMQYDWLLLSFTQTPLAIAHIEVKVMTQIPVNSNIHEVTSSHLVRWTWMESRRHFSKNSKRVERASSTLTSIVAAISAQISIQALPVFPNRSHRLDRICLRALPIVTAWCVQIAIPFSVANNG